MIVPDFIPSKNSMFWTKLKRKFYRLRYRIEIFWTCKLSLKYRHAGKFIKEFTADCNRLADELTEQIKEPFNITAEVVDPRWAKYKEFGQLIDAISSECGVKNEE